MALLWRFPLNLGSVAQSLAGLVFDCGSHRSGSARSGADGDADRLQREEMKQLSLSDGSLG